MARPKFSSPQTLKVLEMLVRYERLHGFAIVRLTGLQDGTVYPILKRLLEAGYLEAAWQLDNLQGPPKKVYRLTLEGIELYRARRASARGV